MDAWSLDLVVSLESWVDFLIENAFFFGALSANIPGREFKKLLDVPKICPHCTQTL